MGRRECRVGPPSVCTRLLFDLAQHRTPECALVIVSKLWNHVVYSCSAGEVLA